jgi:glycosyltransferase involved in cell wall biosynthesis
MGWSKKLNSRKVGDAHRDACEWAKAAAAYKRHLDANPEDAPIWVQYGHTLKEQGKLEEARSAYEIATDLAPDEPDAWLHLGHLLKRMDKPAAALGALQEARLRGAEENLEETIGSLMRDSAPDVEPLTASHEYLFSIQDMFGYLKAHSTMSGIQRVQAGIALKILDSRESDAGFILTGNRLNTPRGILWLLNPENVRGIIEYASGSRVDHIKLRRLLEIAEHSAVPITAGAGTTVVLLGAFWGHRNTVDQYLPAKRSGARIAAYIYDVIPISHPEYCDAALVRDFTASLSELCLICDYMLTISDYTRITLDRFMADHGTRQIPTATVPLAHSLTGPPSAVQTWPKSLLRLKGREYVAYVSTVEGRKNHLYVVNVWRQLMAQGVDVPDLVFVGRKGWRISGLMDLLDGTRNLDGRVHIVHDLTDAELNAVYENSLFTVFTSFVEGWGLPVGESLMHHVPCVASSTSSIPEVGGDFVDYVDPLSVADGISVIGRMLTDREYLAERRRKIVENFRPRGWDEVARTFLERMRAHEHLPVVEAEAPTLVEGRLFRPSDIVDREISLDAYVASPNRLLIADWFYRPEDFGAWMCGKFGEIAFRTGLHEGTSINVYFAIKAAPWYGNCRTTIVLGNPRDSEARSLRLDQINNPGLFYVSGRVGENGVCRLSIVIEGDWQMPEGDTRDFAVGLVGLGYARSSNLEARTNLLESFIFRVASAPLLGAA